MDAGNIVLYGLGAVALAGGLALFLPKILGGSSKKKLLDMFKKEQKQKELQEEIKAVTQEQKVIATQIKASENASEETKEKIKKNLQAAAVEIQKILKEDNLSAIDAQIEEDWGEL